MRRTLIGVMIMALAALAAVRLWSTRSEAPVPATPPIPLTELPGSTEHRFTPQAEAAPIPPQLPQPVAETPLPVPTAAPGWRLIREFAPQAPTVGWIAHGMRLASGDTLRFDGQRPVLVAREPQAGEVAIEVEVTFRTSTSGDFGIFVAGEPRGTDTAFSGIQAKFGAPGQPVLKVKDGNTLLVEGRAHLQAGFRHRLRAELVAGRVRMFIDGDLVADTDCLPRAGVVGVNGWEIDAHVHALRVYSVIDGPLGPAAVTAPAPVTQPPLATGANEF